MKGQRQKAGPVTITVEMLINVLRLLEPQSRLGILLGGLVATADELHFAEAELIRWVRVACVQRAIAMQLAKDNQGLVNAAGQRVMPAGPVDLSRPIPWRCPLCESEVPAGVKHKHTAAEWMTGKRVASSEGLKIDPKEEAEARALFLRCEAAGSHYLTTHATCLHCGALRCDDGHGSRLSGFPRSH